MKNEFLSTYVANNLRACQLKQLSILEEMDRICQKAPPDLLAGRRYIIGSRAPRRIHPLG